ncbi:hypothetical protein [Streptomyces sp. NPDC059517]|uniref:hypothetical protein n=1 Tax=unclassified Streptomyces TaxID=2593676 RepID=UPI0036318FCF
MPHQMSEHRGGAVWIASLVRRWPDLVDESSPTGAVRDITDGVVELEEAVRERLGLRPVPPASVPVRLRRIAGLLDRIAADPLLAPHVEDETRRMAARCARALGDPEQLVRPPCR